MPGLFFYTSGVMDSGMRKRSVVGVFRTEQCGRVVEPVFWVMSRRMLQCRSCNTGKQCRMGKKPFFTKKIKEKCVFFLFFICIFA
jgi:hypothetical protein